MSNDIYGRKKIHEGFKLKLKKHTQNSYLFSIVFPNLHYYGFHK